MHVNSLMVPLKDLQLVRLTDQVGDAINHIKDCEFLSLPVLDEHDVFVGVLSLKYVYEQYFNNPSIDREAFLKLDVSQFMKEKIPVTKDNIFIEEAALLLHDSKLRFLPIVDETTGKLKGIITAGVLLGKYKDIFGMKYPKLILNIYDFKGKLAEIATIITKAGGNIKNIVQTDLEVMGFTEITLRVDAKDIHKVVENLEHHGIEVREFYE